MRAHLAYLAYVMRHKWYVFLELWTLHTWLAIVHDWSKFLPAEWFPYVHHFYNRDGTGKQIRSRTGYYKPANTDDLAFDLAWFHHQRMNKHHWQYWLLPEDGGEVRALEIPYKYLFEMLADWAGAARAQGKSKASVLDWYEKNKSKMLLHPTTRKLVERRLEVEFKGVR